MIDIVTMVKVLIAGLLLGGFFFAGLFLTIRRGLSARNPAVWFLGSWFLRMAVVLGGFYLIAAGQWERFAVCTAGFLIARVVMIRLAKQEPSDAS